jgi:hypothetical protein
MPTPPREFSLPALPQLRETKVFGQKIRYYDMGGVRCSSSSMARSAPGHSQQPLIQTIVDELNGHGKCASTGESAARTAQVMDAILAEFREHSTERNSSRK